MFRGKGQHIKRKKALIMNSTEIKNLIVKYAQENNTTDVLVGIRSLTEGEDYKVGDIAEDSYEWDLEHDISTYHTSGLRCDGTCASGQRVDSGDEEELDQAIADMIEDNSYYIGEKQALLMGTREGDYGTRDDGEVRIVNAEVIAFI